MIKPLQANRVSGNRLRVILDASADPWSVRILYIFIGAVISAIVGWLSSQVNQYRDSRKHHLDEIKKQILEPARAKLQAANLYPQISAVWSLHTYNPNATSSEVPVAAGPILVVNGPSIWPDLSTDEALLEDARARHYPDLMNSLEKFRDTLLSHMEKRERFVEELSNTILETSGLDAHPSSARNGFYVMHRTLGVFVYDRLMEVGQSAIRAEIDANANLAYLKDGGNNLAMGRPDQIKSVHQLVDSLITSNRQRIAELKEELSKLYSVRNDLSRRFSYAIAAKSLPKSCDLVPFFQL